MEIMTLDIIQAMLQCHYKAWQLANGGQKIQKEQIPHSASQLKTSKQIENEKIAHIAWNLVPIYQKPASNNTSKFAKPAEKRLGNLERKATQLLYDIQNILEKENPPPFYQNEHCPECLFQSSCLQKLKEKDCISLLGGMTQKVLAKYHNRGVFSIAQLSYLFKPRRRGRNLKTTGRYLWELKSLALREQKTYVLSPPNLIYSPVRIYIDFEGLPTEKWHYLVGVIICQEGNPDMPFSYWADGKEDEDGIFKNVFSLLNQFPEAPIYHYGSYEPTAIKYIGEKGKNIFKKEIKGFENRMVNLLSLFRTHIYPPTFSNGLKEIAKYIGFNWQEQDANGLLSIQWRRNWEDTKLDIWKTRLMQYNLDDCRALIKVHDWLQMLTANSPAGNVQMVSAMKRHSPFQFHSNNNFSEDFQQINKAAYFDYQRNKIYWKDDKTSLKTPQSNTRKPKQTVSGKGIFVWRPKEVHEVVIAPPLKKCPNCGHRKLYYMKKKFSSKLTDLKFTSTGIKQHIIEHQSGYAKCAKCGKTYKNQDFRRMHYGDNLMAFALNLYVKYNISHEMVSHLIQEQFGIWIGTMYLVQHKKKWWAHWKPEVDYLWQTIFKSPVIHIDETSFKLSKETGYVWVFATSHTVFYHFTFTREPDFLKEWLKEYKGIIVTDFYGGYETLQIKRQKCLIHLIRDLNDDLFKNPFDDEYKKMVFAFGGLLRKIIETIDKYGLKQVHLNKHLPDTEEFYNEYVNIEHHSELSIKCGKRLKKHWDEIWIFLHHDGIPWNNNNAEAAIKAFAQYRHGVNGRGNERGIRDHLEMLSIAQTCRYRNISFLSFLRRKAGIWENVPATVLPGYLPFNQARQYIHRLGFTRRVEWNEWKRMGKRLPFIPSSPEKTYKNKGWIDLHDWLGFSFLPFKEARTYMRKLGLKNRDEYWSWLGSGQRPKNIPYSPEKEYKHTGWIDLGDWLGTGNKGNQKRNKLPYEQAKAYVQALGLKTQHEYFEWRKSDKRPSTIPSSPPIAYPKEFEGWGKFLGTDRIANQKKEYWSYENAKAFLKALNIQSLKQFRVLYSLGIIPKEIPKNPSAYYSKGEIWNGYSEFWGKL